MTNCIHNKFLEKMNKLTDEEENILAKNISSLLLEIHSEKISNVNWEQEFTDEMNLSLFKHGLIKNQGLKDYVLIDFLNSNTFLLKDRSVSRLIKDNSIFNLKINDDLSLSYELDKKFGDKILDLVDLNSLAYYNPSFAKKIFIYKSKNINSKKAYKLFTYYSAKYTIDLIVKKSKVNPDNEDLLLEYQEIIDFIFDSYEDFTIYEPKWLK
ncbi:hypothetical protein [Helcococcus sueciensis]|nr:hypothetical protein [Helcococcus sueciensis]